ncbi:inositol monophosphatase family protein [Kineococcus sp. SYSU DK004]|uniref:inositol monophosphatase family protein n=1 Tax=Kineococcus sp. SYSU DK004 TaxID=3383125 RepID=UPI003D7E26BB
MSGHPAPDPQELLAVAEEVAAAAGELVLTGRPDRVEVAATKSSPTDVVTAMDHASERLVAERLAVLRPDDGFLGEEGGHRPGTSGLTWVVDPIDGTVNYLYGLRSWSVSVAVVSDEVHGAGRPDPATWTVLAGAVRDPSVDETWTAVRGGGARVRRGGSPARPLRCPEGPELGATLLATGFGYDPQRRAEQAAVLARLMPRVRDLRRIGTASLDLCAVAAGRVDAYYELGLNPWDFAAGWLVAREAGAVVTDFTGGPAGTHGLLAAGPRLHPVLQRALAG